MKYFIILILSFFLSSCSNIITINYPTDVKEIQADKTASTSATIKCGLYIPPEMKASPDINIEEFDKINSKDTHKRINYILDYAKSLKIYISDMKNNLKIDYLNYLQSCTMSTH